MIKFSEFIQLQEKLIQPLSGKKYGQVIFIGGGAGSGKGFAIDKFINGQDYKIFDVDKLKTLYLELQKAKGNSEIANLDLKNPKDVSKLHDIVSEKGFEQKRLQLFLKDVEKDRLPNIIFDTTLKDTKRLNSYVNQLIELGYQSKNIHIIWVLTDIEKAIKNNLSRERVVDDAILKETHKKAKETILAILKGEITVNNVDGEFYVILNNPEETKFSNKSINRKEEKTQNIEGFTYLKVKDSGKSLKLDSKNEKILDEWIFNNTPK